MKYPLKERRGYFLAVVRRESTIDEYAHRFCGENNLENAHCPNCRKPLIKILEIDRHDKRIGTQGQINDYLLFCFACNIGAPFFFYRVLDGRVEIIEWNESKGEEHIPYDGYPSYFVEKKALVFEVGKELQDYIRRLNRREISEGELNQGIPEICRPRHQVWGEPYLNQKNVTPVCPKCGGQMMLMASIADQAPEGKSFTGYSESQVIYHWCEECRIYSAFLGVD